MAFGNPDMPTVEQARAKYDEWTTRTVDMTVREAFAKAGFPVPGPAEIYCNGLVKADGWDWSYWDQGGSRLDFTFTEGQDGWYWCQDNMEPSAGSFCQLDVSELPISENTLAALPEVVRKVVQP